MINNSDKQKQLTVTDHNDKQPRKNIQTLTRRLLRNNVSIDKKIKIKNWEFCNSVKKKRRKSSKNLYNVKKLNI